MFAFGLNLATPTSYCVCGVIGPPPVVVEKSGEAVAEVTGSGRRGCC
jgi:hypothetical protein